MRRGFLIAGAALIAAACSAEGDPQAKASAGATAVDDRIACALHGAVQFARDCVVERRGASIVIHHPDGAFRRFDVGASGSLTTADGADDAVTTTSNGVTELAVGKDRYRLPAVQDHAPTP